MSNKGMSKMHKRLKYYIGQNDLLRLAIDQRDKKIVVLEEAMEAKIKVVADEVKGEATAKQAIELEMASKVITHLLDKLKDAGIQVTDEELNELVGV